MKTLLMIAILIASTTGVMALSEQSVWFAVTIPALCFGYIAYLLVKGFD